MKALKLMAYGVFIWLFFFIFCLVCWWVVEQTTELRPLSMSTNSFLFEPTALLIHLLVFSVLTKRVKVPILIVCFFYIGFVSINAEMVYVFGLIFSPSDIKHSFQAILAFEALASYWLHFTITFLVIAVLVVLLLKSKPVPFFQRHHIKLITMLMVSTGIVFIYKSKIANNFKDYFQLSGQAVPQVFAEKHGFLFSFYYQFLKSKPPQQPLNYSKSTIERIIGRYQEKPADVTTPKPDVIIFFIEAFADPRQVGIETNIDPIPNFRKFSKESLSGLVVSPEIGGRSANPEFELLTNLSMRFLPEKSIPYIDYIHSPYPSIIREFKKNGYFTSALHVASLAFFNYEKVYPLIGFDHVETLRNRPGVEMDPVGRFPSEGALVDRIIELTDSKNEPQFIFSFPNSTHGFWDYDAYLDSNLDVIGNYSNDGKQYLKTYINAIHQADKAIGKLVNHFKSRKTPAVVMVLGDHQPSLPEFRYLFLDQYLKQQGKSTESKTRRGLKRIFRKKIVNSDSKINLKSHQVPYFIWSSNSTVIKKNTSMNFISLMLADMADIETSPMFQLISDLSEQIGVLSKSNFIDQKYQSLLNDYQMIQYDIMSGEKYIIEAMKTKN